MLRRKAPRHYRVRGIWGSHASSCLSKARRAGTASLVQRLWVLGLALRGCGAQPVESRVISHQEAVAGVSPQKHPTQECEPQDVGGLCIA